MRTIMTIITVDDEYDDLEDLGESVYGRLADEAGYLDNGDPVQPIHLEVFVFSTELSGDLYEGAEETAAYVAKSAR